MRFLYLHGFASGPSSSKAQFFARKFAERGVNLEVLRLDGGDFEHLTITSQLGVVEREAGGEPVSLIGSSMGGYLAALYAARHEVGRLVLLAPAFGFARRWPDSLGEETVAQWKATGVRRVFHYGEKRERELSYELVADGLRYEDHPDVRHPTLIFHGTQDDTVPASFSISFAQGRPNVDLKLMPSGHELLDVLEEIWSGTSAFLDLTA